MALEWALGGNHAHQLKSNSFHRDVTQGIVFGTLLMRQIRGGTKSYWSRLPLLAHVFQFSSTFRSRQMFIPLSKRQHSRILCCVTHAVALVAGAGLTLWMASPKPLATPPSYPPPSIPTDIVRTPLLTATSEVPIEVFLQILDEGRLTATRALTNIENNWHPRDRVMLLEVLGLVNDPSISEAIVDLLKRQTGQLDVDNMDVWWRTIWNEKYEPHPQYAEFKARLYEMLDPRFRDYFSDSFKATIRLDEIRWGGVRRDGIPPLKNPATLPAAEATYLSDSDIVFGIEINGESRAYPKRILAWHEMVKDVVGEESINGVYCTLCGSLIIYRTKTNAGVHHELGTSGFLYRSNKLMYDHETESLWSTLDGEPVVGPLVGTGTQLTPLSVVTTTWEKWRTDHPATRVLSLETHYRRNYDEGVAYKHYFSNDDLMFSVPGTDKRLKNKDEVFVVRIAEPGQPPVAISVAFLLNHPIHLERVGDQEIIVLTDSTGANRAYQASSARFVSLDEKRQVIDETGTPWQVTEAAILSPDGKEQLPRLPSHRAFWFGWYSAHPETRLVQ